MKTLTTLCLIGMLFATGLSAERKFDTLENAGKAAARSGKGIFVLCYAIVPGDKTNSQMQFTDAINSDEAIAANADKFELAYVNVFSMAHAQDNQCVDPALADVYGWPCTVSIYAPGATKFMWRKEMSHDDVKGRKEHSKEDIAAAMKEGTDTFVDFSTRIADLEAKLKEDKDLKNDPDTQILLAEAWAKGYVAAKVREHFDEAIKLIKKADQTDSRIESQSLRACEIEYECEAYAAAAKSFAAFAKSFKDSDKTWHAKIMAAKAQAKGGDDKGGKAALEKIIKDKKAEDAHKEAQEALDELEGKGGKERKDSED